MIEAPSLYLGFSESCSTFLDQATPTVVDLLFSHNSSGGDELVLVLTMLCVLCSFLPPSLPFLPSLPSFFSSSFSSSLFHLKKI